MNQTLINIIEFGTLIGFIWSVSYQPPRARLTELKRIRKIGWLSAAILLPGSLFVAVMMNAIGFGGPLFWPLFCGFSAMLGYTLATVYFVLRAATPKS
jgi:hypothetical protein